MDIIEKIKNGLFDDALKSAYPAFSTRQEYYRNRLIRIAQKYIDSFGVAEELRFFSAPGRTEVCGNHTDHQHGCVVAGAIDLDALACAAITNNPVISILSEGYTEERINPAQLEPLASEINTSPALVRGIARKLTDMGYAIGGCNIVITSDVLNGSGLSSSASYEVLIGTILNGLFCAGKVAPLEIARIGQFAENTYFGKPSGLMDQVACAAGSFVFIDLQNNSNPAVEKLEVDIARAGYALCIIDSGADHANLTADYTAITVEMGKVAEFFGKKVLREVDKTLFLRNIHEARKYAGDRATLRAMHYFNENERAIQGKTLLEKNDFESFLKIVRASGFSSSMYLQNITPEGQTKRQDVAFTLALCHELLGERGAFRVHGGGFAGTIQAFVPLDILETFTESVEKALGPDRCHQLSIRNAGGFELK